MKIESLDFFYFSMPEVHDIGDGSQDLLLVRIESGGVVGFGECEASPLVSIASLVTPMSHSACKPIRDSVLGQQLDSVDDIHRIGRMVRANSLDLLQTDHTLSGIDMALWDLLGKRFDVPVYQLLGMKQVFPKQPYASQLFGETPQATLEQAKVSIAAGYSAAKFGWGCFGLGSVADDIAQIEAAREGLGRDATLLIDVGTIWIDDVGAAVSRLAALKSARVEWLEEPFVSGAFDAYRMLAAQSGSVRLAAGEGCHTAWQAKHLIDYADLGYIQIDAGRIGGISAAIEVASHARIKGVTYVNHTFTSHLALAASLLPFAGNQQDVICEYPVTPQSLAWDVTVDHLERDEAGMISLPDRPGLGLEVNLGALQSYLVDVEIVVAGKTLYRSPEF